MYYKLSLTTFVFIGIIACSNNTEIEKQLTDEIMITSIDQLPDDIEGCACYLSKDDSTFNNGEYIFASNNDRICYMSVNNKLNRFRMTETNHEPFTFKDCDVIESYSNEQYDVKINSHFEDSTSYESWMFNGDILIKRKDGEEATVKFVGVCGC